VSAARPTLAVIIPNFNYGRFLPRTLDSVLAQTEPFDEIVVVDDGSTDNSMEVLAGYADRARILRITNSGHLGACRAGLAASTSDYIYSLDADDFAEPGLAARVRAALVGRPAKVQFRLNGVDVAGHPSNSSFPTFPANYNAAAMRQDNTTAGFYICPPTSGNVFSRDVLTRMDLSRFDPRGYLDGSPTLAIPYFGEVVSINEPLSNYRMHQNSASAWSKPTVELLERELVLFHKSWDEVARVVGERLLAAPPKSMYVWERRLMIASLKGRIMVAHLAVRFALCLLRTHLPPRQKIIFVFWSAALIVPSTELRRYLIRMKRSALNRPRGMQAVLNFVLRARRPAT